MKHYLKKLPFCLFVLCLSLQIAVPASAVDSFSDVSTDSPWYEAIEFIHEQGITDGVGSNCFSPDTPITIRQWAVMLCRAFDKVGSSTNSSEVCDDACLTKAYHRGWLPFGALSVPDTNICRGALYKSAFAAIGLSVYDSMLYPGGEVLSSYDNYLRIGKELRLCEENAKPLEIVTRGETAELLYAILTRDFQIDAPPILSEFPIQNDESINLNAYLLELQRIPEPILNMFKNNGWIYVIDCRFLAVLSEQYDASCNGATSFSAKTICVSEASVTLHEFGHFIDGILGFPSQRESFYRDESQGASVFLRDYAMTDSSEYYAEYFAYWLKYHINPEKLEQMQMLTPKTFAYFSELAANNWGCPEK